MKAEISQLETAHHSVRTAQEELERIRADHTAPDHEPYWETISLPLTFEARQQVEAKYGTIFEIDENCGRHLNELFWSRTSDLSAMRFALEKTMISVRDSLDDLLKGPNTSAWTLAHVSSAICILNSR